MLSPVDDVLETLAAVVIDRSHLVGASFGAVVAVEVALTRPQQVVSRLLSPPGGSLIAEVTPDLRAFIETENAALARGDLGAAVEANLTWCVVCCSATGRAARRRRPLAPTPTLRRLPAGP